MRIPNSTPASNKSIREIEAKFAHVHVSSVFIVNQTKEAVVISVLLLNNRLTIAVLQNN